MLENKHMITLGRSVLDIEARAIHTLAAQLDDKFVDFCNTILNCKGRVVVTGIGKSGHIARKIAATLASTGTPAFFLHPAEAKHGDLGMLTAEDVLFALSYSGEAEEILTILPLVKRLNVKILSLTGSPQSNLANLSNTHIDIGVRQEACPLGLAPTTSTTAMLAMGDAIAVAVLEAKGFTVDDFAKSHPGGRLGRRLLLKISDVMHTGSAIPAVPQNAPLSEALIEISAKRLGFTTVVSETNPQHLLGIFTDGDLRRTLNKNINIQETPIGSVMTSNCSYISPHQLASEGIALMEKLKSFSLPVVDETGKLVGALHMHDLFKAGVM